MTVREIQGHLEELYGLAVSPDLISRVTDAVIEDREWQTRPLDCVYPVLIFDALRVKIRDEGIVRNKAVYLALGITTGGEKDVLGIWIEQTEGAKFWLKVMNELKNRGVQDVLIAVVDGLKGFPEAIHTVFPQAQVQTCIVHMVRHSLDYCSYKDRKAVAADLKTIYRAETETMAQARLAEFAEKLGQQVPADRAVVATQLGAGDAVLRLSNRGSPGDLHDERHREPAHDASQDHQDTRLVSQRRCGDQVAVPGAAQHQEGVEAIDPRMDCRAEPVCDTVRRSACGLSALTPQAGRPRAADTRSFGHFLFQKPTAHRLARQLAMVGQLDHLASQQLQRPARPPCRRLGAGRRHQQRLLLAAQLARHTGPWLLAQRRLQVAQHEAPLGARHRRAADADAADNLLVAGSRIDGQQDLRPLQLAHRMRAATEQGLQLIAFLLAQLDPVPYIHSLIS
jgi:hypothetical protein